MRVCLMIEGQEGVTWDQWLALAEACERAGLEGLFRSDHYLSILRGGDAGALDAWTILAGLAARTERIRLGTMVSPVTFRHASVLAKSVVTVDHLSGGRAELGIGAGWYEEEHRAYRVPFPAARERIRLLHEQIALIVNHWTQDPHVLPKPVQRPHPPLIVGGSAKPGTVRPAARYADEYNTIFASPDVCRHRRAVLDEACRGAGRDPASLRLSLMTACVLGADQAELSDRLRSHQTLTGREPAADVVLGTVEQAAERLREYEAAGVERVMLQHLAHEDVAMVELMGELADAVSS
jgi:alkanesulfonate monooxygenase SsuD/methylene tetrahydromethanopterin reductase-like flavin-dependent oxidoreductase (luciferase family)